MADRSFLPCAKTKPAGENICGHQCQRRPHSNLDSTDCHPVAEVFAHALHLPMVVFQFGSTASAATVHLSRSLGVDQLTLSAAAGHAANRQPTTFARFHLRNPVAIGTAGGTWFINPALRCQKRSVFSTALEPVCLTWTALGLARPLRANCFVVAGHARPDFQRATEPRRSITERLHGIPGPVWFVLCRVRLR